MRHGTHAEFAMTGLDGSNPLAFLAALGVLRAATAVRSTSKLRWASDSLNPVLLGWQGTPEDRGQLVSAIGSLIASTIKQLAPDRYPTEIASLNAQQYRAFARDVVASGDRYACDLASALAVEGAARLWVPKPEQKAKGVKPEVRAQPTLLCHADNPAGKRLVGMYRHFPRISAVPIAESTGDSQPPHPAATSGKGTRAKKPKPEPRTLSYFLDSVLSEWTYHDGGQYKPVHKFPAFRWDPAECRLGAFEVETPGSDNLPSVPGANALAVLGLTLLPSVPSRGKVATAGITRTKQGFRFAWPLWLPELGLEAVATVLAQNWLGVSEEIRRARGIFAVLASDRYTTDNGSNFFTPAFGM